MERSEIRGSTTRFPDGAEPIIGPARGADFGQGRLTLGPLRARPFSRDHQGAGSRWRGITMTLPPRSAKPMSDVGHSTIATHCE